MKFWGHPAPTHERLEALGKGAHALLLLGVLCLHSFGNSGFRAFRHNLYGSSLCALLNQTKGGSPEPAAPEQGGQAVTLPHVTLPGSGPGR